MNPEKLRKLYKSHVKFCADNGVAPVPFDEFEKQFSMLVAMTLSNAIAEEGGLATAHYIAVSHKSISKPDVESVTEHCIQCGNGVWVHVAMLEKAKSSKGIICDICTPEITGMTLVEAVANQIRHYGEIDHEQS